MADAAVAAGGVGPMIGGMMGGGGGFGGGGFGGGGGGGDSEVSAGDRSEVVVRVAAGNFEPLRA